MSPVGALVIVVLAGALGACIGSFLNVVFWRVPRGESIVAPPSHCPACETELGPGELVPILSWLVLRGRCRHCGVHISARYPLLELTCGIAFGLLVWLILG
ncbi:MAG: leader peptidase (prepilin peptidase) / N-methyltransferase [Actinomycetota bacterium]|jgi:leader peptidase (prepilin peptidase)/N-methyltransferase|nr:leader peptidase (prepilin peptidase) / N-methyltransferase [Actinomycetota bacterium]